MSDFLSVNNDVLHNVLLRLPAKSFACAACVNRCWKKICGQILSRPRLASALSLNPSPQLAVEEALGKILSKPILPHFAIAFVGLQFCLETTHRLIIENLGSNIPVITNIAVGIIGIDVITNQLKEVKWDLVYADGMIPDGCDLVNSLNRGIVLVVGFVPGLKIGILPLLHTKSEPHVALVDKFVADIQSYTISVSGDANPIGIMFFGDHRSDLKSAVAEIDQKMSRETVIVGDANSYFICTGGEEHLDFDPNVYSLDAVGLVFARDKQNHIGEIKFHVRISSGIVPFGPRLKVVSVWEKDGEFSWLTAKMEGELDILDGSGIIEAIGDTIDDEFHSLFIGVVREKTSGDGGDSLRYLAFHEVLGTEQEVFIVSETGIKPGDSFLFYHSDSSTAISSCVDVYNNLNSLRLLSSSVRRRRRRRRISSSSSPREEVFGGMIFTSSSRGEKFFGQSKMNCMPFSRNFPGVPFGGTFCFAPIGRCAVSEEENDDVRCSIQVFSTVYLVMSYSPTAPQN